MRITENERKTLAIIARLIDRTGHSPKIRDVAEERGKAGLGKSVTAASATISRLRTKGKVEWIPGRHETLSLIPPEPN